MPARSQELVRAWGFRKQTDLATANVLAGIWRMGFLDGDVSRPKEITENDAPEFGKGHEFATANFKSHRDAFSQPRRIRKYTSSDFAAWTMGFGLGKCVKSGAGPNFTYTCTPVDPVVDGIELPYFSVLEAVRQGASDVLDHMLVGCTISGWTLALQQGPGRASSTLEARFIGSGRLTEPSGIVIPAATSEKLLAAATLTLTINGTNYVSTKKISSLEAIWENNHLTDEGFYPGSGTQSGFAVMGRIEVGTRVAGLRFLARFEDGSDELTKLGALTEGTAVLNISFDANNDLTITWHRIVFSDVEFDLGSGLLKANVQCLPMYHTSNGLLTAVAKCNTDNIAQ